MGTPRPSRPRARADDRPRGSRRRADAAAPRRGDQDVRARRAHRRLRRVPDASGVRAPLDAAWRLSARAAQRVGFETPPPNQGETMEVGPVDVYIIGFPGNK